MADLNDISRAITACLEEIGVAGTLTVRMAGGQTSGRIGNERAVDLDIQVHIMDHLATYSAT